MKTNKRFLLAAISIALAFTFPGCSSDSGGSPGGDPAPSAQAIASATGAVQWEPSGSKFLGSTAYTFAGLSSAKIGAHEAVISGNTGGAVTLSHAFAATTAKTASGISVKAQPKLSYTHGDNLDLSGLAVTLSYNDGTSEDVAFARFGDYNIEAEPESGKPLSRKSHDGKGVSVKLGHLSANTANLSVAFPVCGTTEYDPSEKLCDERDDKLYSHVTIAIGTYSETWMAENLNYAATGSSCYQNNDSNCDTYGRLYNWATAMDIAATYNSTSYTATLPHQGVCPSGWHLPSDAEWTALTTAVGTEPGKKLKADGDLWNGTDDYGFAALPGGVSEGSFGYIGSVGRWWSATELSAYSALDRHMDSGSGVNAYYPNKSGLFSVRCVQD
jgi:uncharacterized protein (TIGR02145 family)